MRSLFILAVTIPMAMAFQNGGVAEAARCPRVRRTQAVNVYQQNAYQTPHHHYDYHAGYGRTRYVHPGYHGTGYGTFHREHIVGTNQNLFNSFF